MVPEIYRTIVPTLRRRLMFVYFGRTGISLDPFSTTLFPTMENAARKMGWAQGLREIRVCGFNGMSSKGAGSRYVEFTMRQVGRIVAR